MSPSRPGEARQKKVRSYEVGEPVVRWSTGEAAWGATFLGFRSSP